MSKDNSVIVVATELDFKYNRGEQEKCFLIWLDNTPEGFGGDGGYGHSCPERIPIIYSYLDDFF